jgi:hypothetical protein
MEKGAVDTECVRHVHAGAENASATSSRRPGLGALRKWLIILRFPLSIRPSVPPSPTLLTPR